MRGIANNQVGGYLHNQVLLIKVAVGGITIA